MEGDAPANDKAAKHKQKVKLSVKLEDINADFPSASPSGMLNAFKTTHLTGGAATSQRLSTSEASLGKHSTSDIGVDASEYRAMMLLKGVNLPKPASTSQQSPLAEHGRSSQTSTPKLGGGKAKMSPMSSTSAFSMSDASAANSHPNSGAQSPMMAHSPTIALDHDFPTQPKVKLKAKSSQSPQQMRHVAAEKLPSPSSDMSPNSESAIPNAARIRAAHSQKRRGPKQKLAVQLEGESDILSQFEHVHTEPETETEPHPVNTRVSASGDLDDEFGDEDHALPSVLSAVHVASNINYDREALAAMPSRELGFLNERLSVQLADLNRFLLRLFDEQDEILTALEANKLRVADLLDTMNELTIKEAESHLERAAKANKAKARGKSTWFGPAK